MQHATENRPGDTPQLVIRRPGMVEYRQAWQEMQDFTDRRTANTPDEMWLLEHPPVFTQGRNGKDEHLHDSGDIPVILLTARTEETDRVLGLDLGADDYVVKPFSPRELVARVRSVLRRATPSTATPEILDFGGLVIDEQAREVSIDGKSIEMTPKEFDLIAFLARSPRQVFSRGQLLEQVWDSSSEWQDPATVTVHIRRIRTKIEADPKEPRWLTTVWGVGYRFEP